MPIPFIPLRRALLVWFMIMMAESAHGVLRAMFIAPLLGDFAARQWCVLSGSLIVLFIAWLMTPWLYRDGKPGTAGFACIGLMWVALTMGTEIWMGVSLGLSRERMLEDYNLVQGGMLPLGMIFLGFAPWLAAKLRGTGMAKAAT